MELQSGYNEILIKYVAEYLRKSRGESTEDLIKHKTVLQELCERRGWVYVAYEEIETGESLQVRPIMQQLLKDIENNMYDAVVCIDIDRLGRGTLGEWDYIKNVFQKTGTYIVTPSSLYNLADDNDEFAIDLQTVFARREYKKITKRLSMGKKVGAKLGAWTNGTPPMPYVYQEWYDPDTHKRYYNEKGLVVDQEQFKIYRRIVDAYIKQHKSTSEIAWELNSENIRTRKGNRWSNVTIGRILIDETHLGKIISNKSKGDGHKNKSSHKQPWQRLPREHWTIVENRHQAVKTQEEHEQILIEMARNSTNAFRKPMEGKEPTPLKGLVKCGLCGYGIPLEYKRHGSYSVKKCWHKDSFGNKCKNSGGLAKYILEAIDTQLAKYEQQIMHELDGYKDDTVEVIQQQIKIIEDKLKKKDGALARARVAYDEGVDTLDEYKAAKNRIMQEIDNLDNLLSIEHLKLDKATSLSNHEKLHYITEFKNQKAQGNLTDRELNELYKIIISSIIWTRQNDQIYIKVNFL